MECPRCSHQNVDIRRIFCEECGKQVEPGSLRPEAVLGFVGVANSTSPKIERFWETGDPSVFD